MEGFAAGVIVERSSDIVLESLVVAYTDQEAVHIRYNTTFSTVRVSPAWGREDVADWIWDQMLTDHQSSGCG